MFDQHAALQRFRVGPPAGLPLDLDQLFERPGRRHTIARPGRRQQDRFDLLQRTGIQRRIRVRQQRSTRPFERQQPIDQPLNGKRILVPLRVREPRLQHLFQFRQQWRFAGRAALMGLVEDALNRAQQHSIGAHGPHRDRVGRPVANRSQSDRIHEIQAVEEERHRTDRIVGRPSRVTQRPQGDQSFFIRITQAEKFAAQFFAVE